MMRVLGVVVAALLWASCAFAQVTGPAAQNGYPVGSQPFALSATAAATSVALTINQPVGYQRTYITGVTYAATAGTVTAAASGNISNTAAYTIQNPPGTFTTFGGSLPLTLPTTAVSGQAAFSPPLPGNGSNMVVTTPTFTGATGVIVTVTGYFY